MPLLEVRNLTKTYGEGGTETHALRSVSFSVDAGEWVALMGPSGSGKSTLLHMLGFLERPTSGTYLFDGRPTADLSDEELPHMRNRHAGFVFQMFHLLARTSVLENVKLPLLYAGVPAAERDVRARRALTTVNMAHRLSHVTSQLSGGEKQRVAIARALVNNPRVIFADEPTGNLDSASGAAVMQTLEHLHAQGHTIVLITHESTTAAHAQRILLLHDGQLISDSPIEQRQSHQYYQK